MLLEILGTEGLGNPPVDPTTLYAGPFGYLAALAVLGIYLAKEIRKAREVRVREAEADRDTRVAAAEKERDDRIADLEKERDTERTRRLQVEEQRDSDIRELQKDIGELRQEVEQLRDQAIQDTRAAHAKQVDLIRANGRLLAILARHDISPEEEK